MAEVRSNVFEDIALQSALLIINSLNLEESVLQEIHELLINKDLLQQAAERRRQNFKKKVDILNHAERQKSITGTDPLTREARNKVMQDAEKEGSKYEFLQNKYEQRYGNSN